MCKVTATNIFPTQTVEVNDRTVYFIDKYGNAEGVPLSEMGVTKAQFLAMSPEKRAQAIRKVY